MLHSRFVLPGDAGNAHIAFTDRWGGYSIGAFSSLNLAKHVGDDPVLVDANRAALAQVLDLQADRLSFVSQVHGSTVFEATETQLGAADIQADAQITSAELLGLVVLVADCVPVVLVDANIGVVGVAHAGRRGMVGGVVPATIHAMRVRGGNDIHGFIGPSICPRCYEVEREMRDEVARNVAVSASVSAQGTPAIDVAAGVAEQLSDHGVIIEHFSSACSSENHDLFSYRREGTTGRFAGIAWFERASASA